MDRILEETTVVGPPEPASEYSAGTEFHQRVFASEDYLVAFDIKLETFTILFKSPDGQSPAWAPAVLARRDQC
jgi:hypothetical protein